MHNFTKGIDYILDPTGNTALSGYHFVSPSGNDANDGSPSAPKRTPNGAALVASDNDIIIVNGLHQNVIVSTSWNNKVFEADGDAIFLGDNSTRLFTNGILGNSDTAFIGFEFRDYEYLTRFTTSNNRVVFNNCLIYNSPIYGRRGSNTVAVAIQDCKIINSTIDIVQSVGNFVNPLGGFLFDNNTLINSPILSQNVAVRNSIIDGDLSLLTGISAEELSEFTNNIIRGAITYEDVVYTSLNDFKVNNPTLLLDSISDDPMWLGDPQKTEFLVSQSSQAFLRRIGNVSTGILQNESSAEMGNPELFQNLNWNNSVLTSFGIGRIELPEIDLGQLFDSGNIGIPYNALLDLVNNVPDANNAMSNPNWLVYEFQYAGLDKIYDGIWKKARTSRFSNRWIVFDGNGRWSGEEGFLNFDLSTINIRYIKIAVVIRNDFNRL